MWFTMRKLGIILLIFALNHNKIHGQAPKSEACSLNEDEGTGNDVVVYMYYNAKNDSCFPFRYNGKGGNANRFTTEKQCMRNCSHKAEQLFPMDEIQSCKLPKKSGECLGHYLRYYYSPEHHACKPFYWTGCVGNGNRFLSIKRCNDTCYNAADLGHEDHSDESDVPVGIILGVVLGLIGVIILIVVIVFAVKKPSSKKHENKDAMSAAQPLKEQAIEMGGGEALPGTLEISTISTGNL